MYRWKPVRYGTVFHSIWSPVSSRHNRKPLSTDIELCSAHTVLLPELDARGGYVIRELPYRYKPTSCFDACFSTKRITIQRIFLKLLE